MDEPKLIGDQEELTKEEELAISKYLANQKAKRKLPIARKTKKNLKAG